MLIDMWWHDRCNGRRDGWPHVATKWEMVVPNAFALGQPQGQEAKPSYYRQSLHKHKQWYTSTYPCGSAYAYGAWHLSHCGHILHIPTTFEAIHHLVGVSFFFTPCMAYIFLVIRVPALIATTIHPAAWCMLMPPILILELKIYGQWLSRGEWRLCKP